MKEVTVEFLGMATELTFENEDDGDMDSNIMSSANRSKKYRFFKANLVRKNKHNHRDGG